MPKNITNIAKREVKNYLDLKVHYNKRNGQGMVIIPSKRIGKPKTVRILK